MQNTIIESVIKVASEIFSTMISVPLNPGEPQEYANTDRLYDFTGIIGLSGSNPGALGIRLPKRLAIRIAEKMLGTDIAEGSTEARDTVGELTNMIAGGLKNEMDKAKFYFDISIPTVIAGDQHTFTVMGNSPGICIPFHSEGETFLVEICFKKR